MEKEDISGSKLDEKITSDVEKALECHLQLLMAHFLRPAEVGELLRTVSGGEYYHLAFSHLGR